MANEEKLDFTQEPIIIELGYSVLPIVTIAENKKIFLSSLEQFYSNIEPDKNQAFHWLKKMSYYGIPQDIHKLAHFYNIGEGCELDQIQFEKLRELLNPNSYSKRKF